MQISKIYATLILLVTLYSSSYAQSTGVRQVYSQGVSALERDDYISAIIYFRSSIQLNPNFADSYLKLAESLYLIGEYNEALKEIAKAMNLSGKDNRYVIMEARILTALAQYDKAMELYNSVLVERPYDAQANRGLGEIYAILGRHEQANMAYAKSLEYAPGNLRVLLQLVILHDKFRERNMAENALNEALKLYPDNIHVRIQAANHYALYNDWENSSQQINRALSMLKGIDDVWYERVARIEASLALRRGDPDAAIKAIKSFKIDDDTRILFLLARAYRQIGEEKKAQDVLRNILYLNNEDEIARIFRETALVHNISGMENYRKEAARWHLDKAKRLQESFYYEQAYSSYRRARLIDSTDPEIWLLFANIINLRGFPSKYHDELNAAIFEFKDDDPKRAEVQELLEYSQSEELSDDWGISEEWNIDVSTWKMGVFFIEAEQSLPFHYGAGESLSYYFADMMDGVPQITIVNLSEELFAGIKEVKDFPEAFQNARNNMDYFLLLQFGETTRSFNATARLYLARTGEMVHQSSQIRTGKEKVFDAINLLVSNVAAAIPMRMKILDAKGSRLLLDKGRWHGIKEQEESSLIAIKKGAARPSISAEEGIEYAQSDYLGAVNLVNIYESLSEGEFLKTGDFNFISSGDEVFYLSQPEPVDIESVPDPAFRSRLLAIP